MRSLTVTPDKPTWRVASMLARRLYLGWRDELRLTDGVPLALTKQKRFRAHHAAMAARDPNFRLQFLAADQGDPVLEDRLLAAIDADDAAREAAFWGWPAGARVCRIADHDGQEVASVARFS